jgi:hypothetical protein
MTIIYFRRTSSDTHRLHHTAPIVMLNNLLQRSGTSDEEEQGCAHDQESWDADSYANDGSSRQSMTMYVRLRWVGWRRRRSCRSTAFQWHLLSRHD